LIIKHRRGNKGETEGIRKKEQTGIYKQRGANEQEQRSRVSRNS
jgi:hypothetical protein